MTAVNAAIPEAYAQQNFASFSSLLIHISKALRVGFPLAQYIYILNNIMIYVSEC